MCHVNVFDMKGFYSIKIWRFNFICGKIYSNPDGKIKSENSIGVINKEYDKNFVKLLAINWQFTILASNKLYKHQRR